LKACIAGCPLAFGRPDIFTPRFVPKFRSSLAPFSDPDGAGGVVSLRGFYAR
jgi:hypothetical protein